MGFVLTVNSSECLRSVSDLGLPVQTELSVGGGALDLQDAIYSS